MLVKEKRVKPAKITIIILSVIAFFSLLYLLFWAYFNFAFTTIIYIMDDFTEEQQNIITDVFDLPNSIEPELLELHTDNAFRDSSAMLVFSAGNAEALNTYLTENFNYSSLIKVDFDDQLFYNEHKTITVNGEEYSLLAEYTHKQRWVIAKQFVTDDGRRIYSYTIDKAGEIYAMTEKYGRKVVR